MPAFIANVPIVTSTPTIAVEGLPVGSHRFQLIVEDESGNRSQPSFATVTVLNRAPVVTSVSPSFGKWGDQVVIGGANFDPVPLKNRVSFNGVAAQVETATSTQLTVRVPQPATTGLVKVATGSGEGVSPTLFVIPRVFTIEVGRVDVPGQQLDLALDSAKGNLWVLTGYPGTNFGTLEVINLEQKELLGTVFLQRSLVQSQPKDMAVGAAGERRMCVVLNSDGVVSAIDLDSMKVVANIQVGLVNPLGVPMIAIALDISPDGRWAYVLIAPLPSINLPGSISVIDMTTFKVVSAISVGPNPSRVAFSRDGQFAAVSNTGNSTISLIDASSLDARAHKVLAVIKVGGGVVTNLQEVAFSQNTFPIWTANLGSRNASVINKDALAAAANVDLGFNPMTVAVNSNGTRAFLMGPQEKLMAIVDTAAGQPVLRTIKMSGVAGSVEAIATTPDDRSVIAIHSDTNAMSVLETKTLSVRAIINLPTTPFRCRVTSDGKFAVVLCLKTLSILDMESVLPTGA